MAFLETSSSSFSSSSHSWTYDVFLSFRGEDTRNNFTAHLYHALCQNGINTFIDDNLKRGEEISSVLLKSIEESRISIVVFSKNYASSRWCLDELSKILECKETKQQIVVPIFYDVDPSNVRNQTKDVEKVLRFKDDMKVRKWKATLKEVASLSGWHLRNRENESKFIQEIVHWLNSRIMSHAELYIAKHPVGIKPRLQKLHSFLRVGNNDILMVGIYGPGGIGKTTIAKAIYNSIAFQFDGTCFLPNVRETSQRDGLIHLQNKILSKVLGVSSLEIDIVDQGVTIMKQRFHSKKVFLVLDDVNEQVQLEKLAGKHDWFGIGSKIIITTRDKGLLFQHGVDLVYDMNELNEKEAFELFCWNAFKGMKPTEDFVEITKEVLNYARGLPLALEVMGSDLFGKSLQEWKCTLDRYKGFPNKDIQNILRVSYDALDDNAKYIFLDIACFFVGKPLYEVFEILKKCGFFPKDGIGSLVNKSLMTITHDTTLQMHDLLRDMGREIVRQESPTDPGKRSRLWFHEDVRRVLKGNTGTKKIQGILVDFPKEDVICLSPHVFDEMKNLRLFLNRNGKFSTTPNFFSNELRVFDWSGFSEETLPPNFRGENLITLNIHGAAFEIFKTNQNFKNLLNMKFSNCNFLRELPDISSIPNLEQLVVSGCDNLVTVHRSIGSHDKLRWLKFDECPNLKNLPGELKMRSSSCLLFSGCPKLGHFQKMECPLDLHSAALATSYSEELPSSSKLIQPRESHLSGCTIVDSFLDMIYPLQSRHSIEFTTESETSSSAESLLLAQQTDSNVCNVGRAFPLTSRWSSVLTWLNLSGSNIISLPNCVQDCCHLRGLGLTGCRKLKNVSRLPPYLHDLYAVNCESLESFRLSTCNSPWTAYLDLGCCRLLKDIENDIQYYLLREDSPKYPMLEVSYVGHEIPDWFSYKKIANGNSCEIDIIDLEGEIRGIAFCVAPGKLDKQRLFEHEWFLKNYSFDIICDGLEIFSDHEFVDPTTRPRNSINSVMDNVTLIFRSFEASKLKGDSLQVRFRFEGDVPKLVNCGVHLVLGQEEKPLDWMTNRHDVVKEKPLDGDGGNLESNEYPQRRKHLPISGVKKFKRQKSSEQEQVEEEKTAVQKFCYPFEFCAYMCTKLLFR